MRKILFLLMIITIACMAGVTLKSCKKVDIKETTTTDVNMLDYLKQDTLKRFSLLIDIVNRTGYDAFLNAYGTYTLFAPTDDAINSYLKSIGKSSLDQLTVDQMKDIIRFHMLEEIVSTADFNDGKLPSVTMYGQFLVTGVSNKDGISSFVVNRQALVKQANIIVGNGIIQVVDAVLTPTTYTLAQLAAQNPDYSVFTEALKGTGYYDTLNSMKYANGSQRWLTLIAETNKALADSGFHNYAELKAKYCNTGDPKNPKDSLHLYVAYHILDNVKYLADIVMSGSHQTLAPLEVVTDKMINKKVLLNDDEYSTIDGTVHEPGVELEQAGSDVSATNGVLHKALGHLKIKVRNPFPVYWDLCAEVPELTRLTAVYKKKTYLFDYGDGNTLKDVKWEKSCLKYRAGVTGYLGDYWQMGLGTKGSNTDNLGDCAGNTWIEFTTPLLVKGKYKVWFTYFTQNTSKIIAVQGSFDSIPLNSALIQFHAKISTIDPLKEAEQEALGWKWWAGAAKKSGSTAARMLGIVDVKVTGRHKIRFDLVSGSNSDCNFDMVHFIPVGMNQTVPRFNPDGSIEY
ncbi:fasciclin domain-containing protein [Pinibacter soli]|uniref:Fasciclin domain-containing protein n=1 Tax=Pinibacter soli TaxID=3044211 RepID=A0ABT6R9H3_9BACT|nr:fasciclin domain-containing protein [Pinibacter soli]MDI3319211.1 fasciclin domain-containing protein [Pinibacter soli]